MVLISRGDRQRPAQVVPGKKVHITLHIHSTGSRLLIGHADYAGNIDIHCRDTTRRKIIVRSNLCGFCVRRGDSFCNGSRLGCPKLQTALRGIQGCIRRNIGSIAPGKGDLNGCLLAGSAGHANLGCVFIDILSGGLIRKYHVEQAGELLVHLEQLVGRHADQRIGIGSLPGADVNSLGRQIRQHTFLDGLRRQLVIRRCRSHQ